jgi:hypothetical protein
MRLLSRTELVAISGGMETVDVVASRIGQGWQRLGYLAFEELKERMDLKDLIKRAAPVWVAIEVADFIGLDDLLFEKERQINEREDKAQYDPTKLKREVVDGHVQYRVMDDDGNPTNRYWLDCDGDGRLDTQYKDEDGKRYMDVTANGQWHEMPNRADWRSGWAPPGST